MNRSDILAKEGNPQALIEEMKRLAVMGLMDQEGRERLLIAAAQGTERSVTYEEATRVVHWAYETLLAASVLESILAGHCDVDASGPELKFGMTPDGEKYAEEAILEQVKRNEGFRL